MPSSGLALAIKEADSAASVTTHSSQSFSPLVSTQVRRSSRSNKYDGFKVPSILDVKAKKSRVKKITVPSVIDQKMDKVANLQIQEAGKGTSSTFPPTPIPVLQNIGIQRCGVPPEALL